MRDAGEDYKSIILGLKFGGVPSINSLESVYNFQVSERSPLRDEAKRLLSRRRSSHLSVPRLLHNHLAQTNNLRNVPTDGRQAGQIRESGTRIALERHDSRRIARFFEGSRPIRHSCIDARTCDELFPFSRPPLDTLPL